MSQCLRNKGGDVGRLKRSWDGVRLLVAHALVSHRACLRLLNRCAYEADHDQPARRARATGVRTVRQARPGDLDHVCPPWPRRRSPFPVEVRVRRVLDLCLGPG